MSTQLQITGKIVQSMDGGSNQISLVNSSDILGFAPSGSKGVASQVLVNTSITSLDTGSCSTIGMMAFKNVSTSSIQVYSDAAGTKIVTTLQPGQATGPVWWTGSSAFWAKTISPATPGTLYQMFNEL